MHSTKIGTAVAMTALLVGATAAAHGGSPPSGGTEQPQGAAPTHQERPGTSAQPQPGAAPAAPAPGPAGTEGRQAAETPAATAAQMITAQATVQKVDKANGKLVLKDAQGKTLDVKAGPRINLDQIHPGDKVTATYYEEVAMGITKATQGAPRMTQTTVERGGVTARQATVTARIESVDPSKNLVTIKTPSGETHELKVEDPDLQGRLKQIKAGENFDVTYTQAVAISVEPRK